MSGRRVKGCTGGRTRSAGRSPSTERVRMQAKRTLDAAGTIDALVMGVGGFKAAGRPPAPLTTEGDSLPFPAGRGGGDGRASAYLGGLFNAQAAACLFCQTLQRWQTDVACS